MSDQTQTISIPSLVLLAAFTALTIRYFFFNRPSSDTPPTNPRAANPADVERIAAMFPQLDRRQIIWDLQRNGGSAAATIERMLTRGTLDQPPPTFQPPIMASATLSTAGTGISVSQVKQEHIDLIKRYNLSGKIASPPAEGSEGGANEKSQDQMWSDNKNERQALFQRRREEMILNARRKLEEKEKGKKFERA